MKAIFIDATKRQVSEVEISDTNTLNEWYKILDCYTVEVATYINEQNDSILVDEEGLLHGLHNDSPFFKYEGAHQPFAGNGLITGVDEDGNDKAPTVTVKDVKSKITFLTLAEARKQI